MGPDVYVYVVYLRSGIIESRDVDSHVSGMPQAGSCDQDFIKLLRGSYTPLLRNATRSLTRSRPISDRLATSRYL